MKVRRPVICFLILAGWQCASREPLFLDRTISFPFRYYEFSGSEGTVPIKAYWDKTETGSATLREEFILFQTDQQLRESASALKKGRPEEAAEKLRANLEKLKDPDLRGCYSNNLAAAEMLQGNLGSARALLNQAGILLPGDHHVLRNLRLVAGLEMRKIKIIKMVTAKEKP